jgi:sterol desaturase/sphingolipid hydroxylase (fatty acid hydroxylase superfamily)
MIAVERARPGRNWPAVRGWWARAILVNVLQTLFILLPGWLWEDALARSRPWSADALGVIGGGIAGYVATTFVYYWWHRARHASPFLWRLLHQVHHTPQRIEVIASFYKHPFEILSDVLITDLTIYLLVGLGKEAAAVAVVLSGVAEFFYHWNIATPRWLGYLIQRPESHCVHHQEGLHAFNYGDLPIWDILFGTFRNPVRFDGRCGFGEAVERRLPEMLLLRDVTS